jgi:16S rRNA (guanine527-N7)-methyltransferase
VATSLSTDEIARELADYGVELPELRLQQLSAYLELLLRWNRRVNLTAIREPRQIVRRLFGESLYLADLIDLKGWLVDVGSGAGFPGLALKLAAPDLRVTLIESRQRKCAFLKEVARTCRLEYVDVVGERFENWAATTHRGGRPDYITTRAVAMGRKLLASMRELLGPGGKGVFVTTTELTARIQEAGIGWKWEAPLEIPHSGGGVILVGIPESNDF